MRLPYAVICPAHGQVFLTDEEYDGQNNPDDDWICPVCGCRSEWDKAAEAECEEESRDDEPDSLRTLGLSEKDFR